jgi:uncharacterized protein YhfF
MHPEARQSRRRNPDRANVAEMADARLLPMRPGDPETDLRRRLVDAVLRGEKTATSSLRAYYAPHTDEPLPRDGEHRELRGVKDEPVAVVEITEVRVIPIVDVDLTFVRDEGEGFESIADWRAAHEEFWADREIWDKTPVVAQRFTVVERLQH